MMPDSIREILRRADEVMGKPAIGRGDLASVVRGRAKKQRKVRTVVGSVTALVGIVWVMAISHRQRTPVELAGPISPPPAVDSRRAQTEAKVDLLMAGILETHELKNARVNAAAPDEYLWRISQERYRAASILVRGGERIYEESHNRPAAEANYRQAIQLFPDSPAAMIAREHLLALNGKGSES